MTYSGLTAEDAEDDPEIRARKRKRPGGIAHLPLCDLRDLRGESSLYVRTGVLRRDVFRTSKLRDRARKHLVLLNVELTAVRSLRHRLLEIDFPKRAELPEDLTRQNGELQQKDGIRGYPTILFLDASGKVLGRSGDLAGGPEIWTQDAENELR